MEKQLKRFPLIADDEPVITHPRQMTLYDNEDLIVNIRGDYRDKTYGTVKAEEVRSKVEPSAPQPLAAPSQRERLRHEARADVKKKRQALVLPEKKRSSKALPARPIEVEPVSQRPATDKEPGETNWSSYAKVLEQTDYILVDLPKTYQQPANPSTKGQQKQNFDFLKQSQVYNYKDNQRKKERQIAQELNLSALEDNN